MTYRSARGGVLLLPFFIAAPSVIAQTNSGELTGRVTDKSESVVPDAQVLIRNTGTGDVRETLSNNEGCFVATFLPPGQYEVTASAQGFMKAVLAGIRIEAGQRVNVSLVLDVGSVSESVTVSATAQQVNTEDAKVRHVIDSSGTTFRPTAFRPSQCKAIRASPAARAPEKHQPRTSA